MQSFGVVTHLCSQKRHFLHCSSLGNRHWQKSLQQPNYLVMQLKLRNNLCRFGSRSTSSCKDTNQCFSLLKTNSTNSNFYFTETDVCPIYTNWFDWYWVMFFFARPVGLVRLVLFVRVVQWFTSRTVDELHIIRETYSVYWSPRPVRLVRLVRVVKQWFTSRSIGELYIIRET